MKPGARLDAFRLRFDGEAGLSINRNGEAEIALTTGTLVQRAPVMYQEIDVRKAVRGSYVLLDSRTLGFRADACDTAHTLVGPDPDLWQLHRWHRRRDGGGCHVGADGSLYLTGSTTSPALFGRTKPSNWGDVFVIKLLPGGTAVDFVTYLGGVNSDYGFGITIDPQGRVVVGGSTFSADFLSPPAREFGSDRGIPRTPDRRRFRRLQLDPADRPGRRLRPQRDGWIEQRRLSRRTFQLVDVERPDAHSNGQGPE